MVPLAYTTGTLHHPQAGSLTHVKQFVWEEQIPRAPRATAHKSKQTRTRLASTFIVEHESLGPGGEVQSQRRGNNISL